MSTLLDIGSQCSHETCSEQDFLPIACRCNKSFCGAHISPEIHHCTYVFVAADLPFEKLQRCELDVCSQPSLNAYKSTVDSIPTCSQCLKSFCAAHRHPSSHSCPVKVLELPDKSAAARALLAKNFPAASSSSSKKIVSPRIAKVPTDPVKLAQYRKVELMKMRHRATPGDPKDGLSSTPLDQRLHVKITDDGGAEQVFWFRKTMIAGRVLDFLATKMRSSNSSPGLQLTKVLASGSTQVLRNDKPIGDQVEDGDTLVITRIQSPE